MTKADLQPGVPAVGDRLRALVGGRVPPGSGGRGRSGPEAPCGVGILQDLVFSLTNDARRRHGVPSLTADRRLDSVAHGHSTRMCHASFFSHDDPEGRTPRSRVAVAFPEFRGSIGENILMIGGSGDRISSTGDMAPVAGRLLSVLMASPGHRGNILNADFTWLGVGVHMAEDEVFATQLFARPTVVFDAPQPDRVPPGIPRSITIELGPDLGRLAVLEALLDGPGSPPGGQIGPAARPLIVHLDCSARATVLVPGLNARGGYRLFAGGPPFLEIASFDIA